MGEDTWTSPAQEGGPVGPSLPTLAPPGCAVGRRPLKGFGLLAEAPLSELGGTFLTNCFFFLLLIGPNNW